MKFNTMPTSSIHQFCYGTALVVEYEVTHTIRPVAETLNGGPFGLVGVLTNRPFDDKGVQTAANIQMWYFWTDI